MRMSPLLAPPPAGRRTPPMVRALLAASSVALVCAALVLLFAGDVDPSAQPIEDYSALRTGRYAMRAERQAHNYELDAERAISLATGYDASATEERRLSAEEEKRSRKSSYLASDARDRMNKVLQTGRQEVNEATGLKSKAGRLQDKADKLEKLGAIQKKSSHTNDKSYHSLMATYGKAVDRIQKDFAVGKAVYKAIDKLSLRLADLATKYTAAKKAGSTAKATQIKLQLSKARAKMAKLEAKKPAANARMRKAKSLAAKYRPVIEKADAAKKKSDLAYASYANLKQKADTLEKSSAGLLDRAAGLQALIRETEKDLKAKRRSFLHYKNRASTELAISVHAEDQEDSLRAAARKSRAKAGAFFSKAKRLRQLAQKGVQQVMSSEGKNGKAAAQNKMAGLQV